MESFLAYVAYCVVTPSFSHLSREFDQGVAFVNDALQFNTEEILMRWFGWLFPGLHGRKILPENQRDSTKSSQIYFFNFDIQRLLSMVYFFFMVDCINIRI